MNELAIEIDAKLGIVRLWYTSLDPATKCGSRELLAEKRLTDSQLAGLISGNPSVVYNIVHV